MIRSSSVEQRITGAWEPTAGIGFGDENSLRGNILASWHRCSLAGLQPQDPIAPRFVSQEALERASAENAVFIKAVRRWADEHLNAIANSGFALAVVSPSLWVLDLLGKSTTIGKLERFGLRSGISWLELEMGTNAFALAALEHVPVQVSGDEHYHKALHGLTVAAAPVWDAQGTLRGVLGLCGAAGQSHPHTLAVSELAQHDTQVGIAVGYPLGTGSMRVKMAEAEDALQKGATALDLQINTGLLKDRRYRQLLSEMSGVVVMARGQAAVKIIIEVGYLNREEIIVACQLVEESGAQFAKSSSGHGERGPHQWEIKLMRDSLSPCVKVNASGIGSPFSTAIALACLRAGADHISTRRAVEIVEGLDLARGIGLC